MPLMAKATTKIQKSHLAKLHGGIETTVCREGELMKKMFRRVILVSAILFSGAGHADEFAQKMLNDHLKKYKFACEEQDVYDMLIHAGSIKSYYGDLGDRINFRKWKQISERNYENEFLKGCANDTGSN
jgi:hypothetical protein